MNPNWRGREALMQIEVVSKIEAAKRLLVMATTMYFDEADTVAIHTLVTAAYNVIHDISEKSGSFPPMLKDDFIDCFEAGKKHVIKKWLNSWETFFKHANRDPDPNGTIEFDPEVTEILLCDAWKQLIRLIGELPLEGKAFMVWAGEPKQGMSMEGLFVISSLKGKNKTEYYNIFLDLYGISKH